MTGRRPLRGELRRARGGAAPLVLGAALLPLLVLLGLGLAEGARAMAFRTSVQRSLAAAVQGAARVEPSRQEAVFRQVLAANLGAGGTAGTVQAWLERPTAVRATQAERSGLMPGGPATADRSPGGSVLTGRAAAPYRLEYLAPWLPPLALQFAHTEPLANRKAAP